MANSIALNMDNLRWLKQIPDGFYDIGIIDPPYGINAPNMAMGSSKTRSISGDGISVAQKLKRNRFNSGGGKLKNSSLQKFHIDWDY
jgi:site-specific DNA-methyltransferase (adenine-specific)